MICEDCYYQTTCVRQPDENGRCSLYVKKNAVDIGDELGIDPMDTLTFDYEDIKKLFDENELTEDQIKKLGL